MEKTVWKLMVNAVFGKTMENIRKRVNIILVNDEHKLRKYHANPYFQKSDVIIPDELASVRLRKRELLYDKPIYVGFTILELSQLWMFQIHYDHVKPKFPDAVLMYTDTDSLIYYVKSPREKFIQELHSMMDLSNIPDVAKKLGLDPNQYKLKPGWFKNELVNEFDPNDIIVEFYAKAPKMYEIISMSNKYKQRSKSFKEGLMAPREMRSYNIEKEFHTIKSVKHEPQLTKITRKMRPENNNKRIFVPGKYETVPYGYRNN